MGKPIRSEIAGAEDLTITITAGAGARTRQYRVSRRMLGAAAVFLGLGLLAAIVFATTYGGMALRARGVDELKSDNLRLRTQLKRLVDLEQQVRRLDRSRRSLLGVAGAVLPDSGILREEPPDIETETDTDSYRHLLADTSLAGPELEEVRRAMRVLPLDGPRTRGFGAIGIGQFHTGIDIAGDTGVAVRAAAEGVVSFVGRDETFGLVLVIAHTSRLSTMYGHNSRVLVRVGDFVAAGQAVSEVGSTGQSSAPHLHFEIQWDGAAADPALVFQEFS